MNGRRLHFPTFWEPQLKLPLATSTAGSLVEAIVENDTPRRVSILSELGRRDPWFGLWVVLSDPAAFGEPGDLDTLAGRVADHLPNWLGENASDYLISTRSEFPPHPASGEPPGLGVGPQQAADILPAEPLGNLLDWRAGIRAAMPKDVAEVPGSADSPSRGHADMADPLRRLVAWLRLAHPETGQLVVSRAPRWLAESEPIEFRSTSIQASAFTPNPPESVSSQLSHEATPSDGVAWERILASAVRARREWAGWRGDFERRLESSKIASLAQFAYGASHEINNPLTNIASRAQSLLLEETHPERRRKLATISAQAFRVFEMIADLMHFAKPLAVQREPVDLRLLIATMVDELAGEAQRQGTRFVCESAPEAVFVSADRNQLLVLLRALCRNSLEALGRGGTVSLTARRLPENQPVAGGGGVEICVRDTGPGIPANIRQHIFDPYFSGREAGRGLGLGLSKCWRIAQNHGGTISVSSEAGRGAEFRVILPDD